MPHMVDQDNKPDPQRPIPALELFPDLKEEIETRVEHAKISLKNWVLAGVIANLLVAVGAAGPVVFYLGQISRDISTSLQTQQAQAVELAARQRWMNDRMIWEARMEAWAANQGFRSPPPAPMREQP